MPSLYEELTPGERLGVAGLLGFGDDGAGFRNNLRDIQAPPQPYTLGDAARLYINFLLTSTPLNNKGKQLKPTKGDGA